MIEGVSVSMDEIARHSGVGVGTVYRHFPTKEDLFAAVIVSHKARLIEEANQLLYHVDPGEDTSIKDIKVLLIGILQATGNGGTFPERVVSILSDSLRA